MRQWDPGVLAEHVRTDEGNDDVRSENCGLRLDGSGHTRRLSADLISDTV